MKRKFILLLLIFTILFSHSLYSDYYAKTDKAEHSICACSLHNFSFDVKNTGLYEGVNSYKVYQTGIPADWSNVFPSSFILKNQESIKLWSTTKVPCDAKGTYELRTIFQDNEGREKIISQNLNINHCDNYVIKSHATFISTCPCSLSFYNLTIKNTNNFMDIFYLDLKGDKRLQLTLSEKDIILNPGEEKTVYLYVNSRCDITGTYKINLDVTSKYNEKNKRYDFNVQINPCYDFNLEFGKEITSLNLSDEYAKDTFNISTGEYTICSGMDTFIPFFLTNIDEVTGRYELSIKGLKNSQLRYNKIESLSKDEKIINIIELRPDHKEISEKPINLDISVWSGALRKTFEIPVNIVWCHTLFIEGKNNYYLGYDESFIDFKIQNKGSVNTTYLISKDAPEWATIVRYIGEENGTSLVQEISTVTLLPEETLELMLRVKPEYSGDYPIKIFFSAENQKRPYTFETNIKVGSLMQGIDFNNILKYLLYLLLIIILIILIIIIIRYFSNRKELKKEETEEKEITDETEDQIDIEETSKEYLKPEEDSSEDKVKSRSSDRRKELTTLIIEIPEKKKKQKKITKNTRKTEEKELKEKKGHNAWWIILLAFILLILLGYFIWNFIPAKESTVYDNSDNSSEIITNSSIAKDNIENKTEEIVINKSNNNKTDNIKDTETNETIILKAVIGKDDNEVKREQLASAKCNFEFNQNEIKKIDLSTYFIDPDGDPLVFDYKAKPENIDVNIEDAIITFRPKENFFGVEQIELTADDGQGGLISSGNLTLCVYEKKRNAVSIINSINDFIIEYKYYIMLGFILLIIILVIIRTSEMRRKNNEDIIVPKKTKKTNSKKNKTKVKK